MCLIIAAAFKYQLNDKTFTCIIIQFFAFLISCLRCKVPGPPMEDRKEEGPPVQSQVNGPEVATSWQPWLGLALGLVPVFLTSLCWLAACLPAAVVNHLRGCIKIERKFHEIKVLCSRSSTRSSWSWSWGLSSELGLWDGAWNLELGELTGVLAKRLAKAASRRMQSAWHNRKACEKSWTRLAASHQTGSARLHPKVGLTQVQLHPGNIMFLLFALACYQFFLLCWLFLECFWMVFAGAFARSFYELLRFIICSGWGGWGSKNAA